MEFIFECSNRYLKSAASMLVYYSVCYENYKQLANQQWIQNDYQLQWRGLS